MEDYPPTNYSTERALNSYVWFYLHGWMSVTLVAVARWFCLSSARQLPRAINKTSSSQVDQLQGVFNRPLRPIA